MILHALAERGQPGHPWLVFLHGFSGDCREWLTVGQAFGAYSRLYIDLPGHGGSAHITVNHFADVSELIKNTLNSYNILKYWLVGYSLGGRIAMTFASQVSAGLCGMVIEGGHPGLDDDNERRLRRRADAIWAQRFRHEPLPQVFADWYQQPVFVSLDAQQRTTLIDLRSHNNGAALAAMLQATSLAEQADLRASLRNRTYPFHYLCGEYDRKFRAIAQALDATTHLINHAGHNAHRENPDAVVACLAQFLAS